MTHYHSIIKLQRYPVNNWIVHLSDNMLLLIWNSNFVNPARKILKLQGFLTDSCIIRLWLSNVQAKCFSMFLPPNAGIWWERGWTRKLKSNKRWQRLISLPCSLLDQLMVLKCLVYYHQQLYRLVSFWYYLLLLQCFLCLSAFVMIYLFFISFSMMC